MDNDEIMMSVFPNYKENRYGREYKEAICMWIELDTMLNLARNAEVLKRKEEIRESFSIMLSSPKTLELLAALEHDRWSRWEKHREKVIATGRLGWNFATMTDNQRESWVKSATEAEEKLQDWKRKRDTLYSGLTEQEKESDRAEARKTIEAILKAIKEG